jgi:hypothetical protein
LLVETTTSGDDANRKRRALVIMPRSWAEKPRVTHEREMGGD